MKRLIWQVILLWSLTIILSGCGPSPSPAPQQIEEKIPLESVTSMEVDLREGRLKIVGSPGHTLKYVGKMPSPPSMSYSPDQTRLSLTLSDSTPDHATRLSVPDDLHLLVEAFSAQIQIMNFNGSLEANTVAGDISYQNGSGEVLLRSGRGDIHVSGGEGKLKVLGEHGAIDVKNFLGPTSLSTIMGEIRYQAPWISSGPVELETDHGPVDVTVPIPSNYRFKAVTTSGILQCVGTHLQRTLSGCEGKTGQGVYPFTIRTVSGRVYLREMIPNQEEGHE
ncbi:MAG: DUF4097 family beta strand repeat-containing protein [Anaerolineales bacterium]